MSLLAPGARIRIGHALFPILNQELRKVPRRWLPARPRAKPHYARVDQEGRTLLHELFAATGDIRVSDSELHITLAPLSSPHRTLAAQALCETLDQTATIFPGSRLRVRFSVRPPPRIGLAFPGSPVERSTATAVPPAP